jgi:hypothetical protein
MGNRPYSRSYAMSTTPDQPPSPRPVHYWIAGDESRQVSILGDDYLYIADGLSKKDAKKGVDALLRGEAPNDALPKAKVVRLAGIKSIDTADHLVAVNVRHEEAGKEKKSQVLCEGDQDRLDAFERLAAAMGPNVQRMEQPLPVGQAVIGPSIALVAVLGGTAIFYVAAADIEQGEEYNPTGRRRAFKMLAHWILEKLGPTGVLIVGAVGLLLAGFWLYRRITSPPRQAIVTRT